MRADRHRPRASAAGIGGLLRRLLHQRLGRREAGRHAAGDDMVELAGVQRLVRGAAGDPDMQPVGAGAPGRSRARPSAMHAEARAARRDRSAPAPARPVRRGYRMPRAASGSSRPPRGFGRSPAAPSASVSAYRPRHRVDLRERRQRRGERRLHPADLRRTDPERQAVARQRCVVAGANGAGSPSCRHRLAFQTRRHPCHMPGDDDEPAPGAGGLPQLCHVCGAPAWQPSARCCPISGRNGEPAPGSGWCSRMGLMLLAKVATVYVPMVYARTVDALAPQGAAAAAGDPGRAGHRLRPAARRLRGVRRAARRAVRQGAAARGARGGAAHLPPSARAEPALPPGPADRRRCRARSSAARAGIQSVLRLAVFNIVPTIDRDVAGHRDHLAPVRLALRRGHLRRGRSATSASP